MPLVSIPSPQTRVEDIRPAGSFAQDHFKRQCVELFADWNVCVYVRRKQFSGLDTEEQESFASKCRMQQSVKCAECDTFVATQKPERTKARCCYVAPRDEADGAAMDTDEGRSSHHIISHAGSHLVMQSAYQPVS